MPSTLTLSSSKTLRFKSSLQIYIYFPLFRNSTDERERVFSVQKE